jgi:thiamine transport system ATP-binding protein
MIEIRKGIYHSGDFHLAMDFAIERGVCVGVLGTSGAGKSTLLSIIAGFEALHGGTITLAGKIATAMPPNLRPTSVVFQDNNCFAHLSAWDNVALGISPSLKLDHEQRKTVDAALQRVNISHLAMRLPGAMSGGERQRIALARVLVRNQPILLLDEPFAALGPGLRHDMLNLVLQLKDEKKLTVLMVTHDPSDAQAICEQILFVDPTQGLVRQPVKTNVFFSSHHDAAVRDYLGPSPAPAATAATATAR